MTDFQFFGSGKNALHNGVDAKYVEKLIKQNGAGPTGASGATGATGATGPTGPAGP